MPELNFTPEQRAAIDTRGSTVLVSAAAGSGKTRVLTERLMAYLTDAEHPVDIDHFLVITYTRAAAAELSSRILDGIYARIASDPENRRLRRPAPRSARSTASAPTSCAPTVQPSPSRRTFRSPIPSAAPPCAQRRSSTRSSAPIHASTPTHPSTCWPTRSAAGATTRAWVSWCSRSMTKCSATHGPSSGRSGRWTCSRSTA
mgnify:CR=1 FL=1